MLDRDKQILRELAKKTMEVANQDIQEKRREMWRDFNSMRSRRVPIFILDADCSAREIRCLDLYCENDLCRKYEHTFRTNLYHASLGDDYAMEPWVTVFPEYIISEPYWESYGYEIIKIRNEKTHGMSFPYPPIKSSNDLNKLATKMPEIDKLKTDHKMNIIKDAIGDIISVIPEVRPTRLGGLTGLSYALGYLVGYEKLLYLLYDDPELIHTLCKIITDSTVETCNRAEEQGLFSNCDGTFFNFYLLQSMPYNREIPEPGALKTVSMKQHWIYDNCQEFESISPEMTNEFLFDYLKPIYEKFGLLSYGCCENLTRKIPYLKKISNLRCIAVTPWADSEECAKQLVDKYIISWRPNPAEMVSVGFDPDRIKKIIKNAKTIFDRYGCYWEVNLKDINTLENEPERLNKWVEIVREVVDQ